MNQSEFAALHGVSRKIVTTWKTRGWLVFSADVEPRTRYSPSTAGTASKQLPRHQILLPNRPWVTRAAPENRLLPTLSAMVTIRAGESAGMADVLIVWGAGPWAFASRPGASKTRYLKIKVAPTRGWSFTVAVQSRPTSVLPSLPTTGLHFNSTCFPSKSCSFPFVVSLASAFMNLNPRIPNSILGSPSPIQPDAGAPQSVPVRRFPSMMFASSQQVLRPLDLDSKVG